MDTQPPSADEQDSTTLNITLETEDSRRLADLCGQFGAHIKQIEQRLNVEIHHRANNFSVHGPIKNCKIAERVILQLDQETEKNDGLGLTPEDVHLALQEAGADTIELPEEKSAGENEAVIIRTKKVSIKPRGENQKIYVRHVKKNDINFGIGPAGTGKTYLAVACAVEALLQDEVERILLVRPAVEAGEKLGFLPGDLSQKVDPYLRPLYDALYEMLGFEVVGKLIERHVIEVAPLAYMRGRTLNNSFVILDESQNTTREQMKMFLTRIGFGSTAVITGDPTQVDLPRGHPSGLKHALSVLDGVKGISFTHFSPKDVVRHPIVQRIVEAYNRADEEANKQIKDPDESKRRKD